MLCLILQRKLGESQEGSIGPFPCRLDTLHSGIWAKLYTILNVFSVDKLLHHMLIQIRLKFIISVQACVEETLDTQRNRHRHGRHRHPCPHRHPEPVCTRTCISNMSPLTICGQISKGGSQIPTIRDFLTRYITHNVKSVTAGG